MFLNEKDSQKCKPCGFFTLKLALILLTAQLTYLTQAQRWNPVSLAGENSAILASAKTADAMGTAALLTLAFTALCLGLSLLAFHKKRL